jgi:GNAT superfamily N-acetyltransferase
VAGRPTAAPASATLHIDRPRTAAELEAYFELRWLVLRAPWGEPRGSERDETEASAHHVTARLADGRLVGVGRLHLRSASEAQIRYMATAEGHRRAGVGRAVAERLEALAASLHVSRIVLAARDEAVGFYRRLGYRELGPGHVLFGTVAHTRMAKNLERNADEVSSSTAMSERPR